MNQSKREITIDEIADSFADRLERGERPSIEEYKRQHPELADEIEAVLPALVMLEGIDSRPPEPQLAVDDSIPRILGEYQIISEIGRGGMGIVFEAQHTTMRRRVALKVLPKSSHEKSKNHLSRFLTEARSAGKLHHTNIVPVFDIGEDQGLHFYAMQFINGHNLDRVIHDIRRLRDNNRTQVSTPSPSTLREREKQSHLTETLALSLIEGNRGKSNTDSEQSETPSMQNDETFRLQRQVDTDPEIDIGLNQNFSGQSSSSESVDQSNYHKRVASIGVQVARALEHAHTHGVLHRDIKPANLILDTEGTVWVTDFGLAKLEAATITQTGDIVGTLRYMAPERFKGIADARSDIYSLGLTLYELAVLQNAVDGDQAKILSDASTRTFTPPSKIDPDIPADLEIIILKSLAIEPERRYQSAQEMAEDLNLFLADRPIRARRVSTLERCWMICKRNPVAASLAACIAVLLLLLGFGGLSFAVFKADQVETEIQNRKEAQQSLYESKLDQAKLIRMSGRLGQRFDSIEAIRTATDLLPELDLSKSQIEQARLNLRNEAIAALLLSDLKSTTFSDMDKDWGFRQRISFSDDMQICAMGNEKGDTQIIRLGNKREDDQILKTIPSPDLLLSRVLLSPDGKYLGTMYQKSTHDVYQNVIFRLWKLDDISKPLLEKRGSVDFEFSADSSLVAFTDVEQANIYSLNERRMLKSINEIRPRFIRLSHDNQRVALSERGRGVSVEIWNITDDPKQEQVLQAPNGVSSLDWDSRQKILVMGTLLGDLTYWMDDFTEPQTISVQQNSVNFVHIHPNKHLVFCDTADATIQLVDLDASQVALRDGDSNFLLFHGFSSDGQIGYASNETMSWGIWEFADSSLTVLKHKKNLGTFARFHPKHSHIFARSTTDSIEFFDCIQGKVFGEISIDPELANGNFCFDHTGEYVYTAGKELLRWPISIQSDDDKLPTLDYEDGQPIAEFECERVFASDSHSLVAITSKMSVTVLNSQTDQTTHLGHHMGVRHMQFSNDGKWLFTGTQLGRGVKVWDLEAGKLANQYLPDQRSAQGTPHPQNANQFVSSSGTIQLWKIGDEEPITKPFNSTFGSLSRFSPDGNILGVKTSNSAVTLFDFQTEQELACIETLGGKRILEMEFSPDGSRLLLSCFDDTQVVDLRALKGELTQLGLDW